MCDVAVLCGRSLLQCAILRPGWQKSAPVCGSRPADGRSAHTCAASCHKMAEVCSRVRYVGLFLNTSQRIIQCFLLVTFNLAGITRKLSNVERFAHGFMGAKPSHGRVFLPIGRRNLHIKGRFCHPGLRGSTPECTSAIGRQRVAHRSALLPSAGRGSHTGADFCHAGPHRRTPECASATRGDVPHIGTHFCHPVMPCRSRKRAPAP